MTEADGDAVDVWILGAGLAGLACAVHLTQQRLRVRLLEPSDGVGGRVRTDRVDGFQLDRGFQVLATAYPEIRWLFDEEALHLGRFEPGALVRFGGRFHRLSDPWRQPLAALAGLTAPLTTWGDLPKLAALRSRVTAADPETLLTLPATTTLAALRQAGFSDRIVDRFFRPFYGGVQLDRELGASSRMFDYTFRMFAEGSTALPRDGMGAIAAQLAERLPPGVLQLGVGAAAVGTASAGGPAGAKGAVWVETTEGDRVFGQAVVAAVDMDSARALFGETAVPRREWRGVDCLYYAADRAPFAAPVLVLNGDGAGPINNLCVPSNAAPSYAPAGRALVSVSVLEEAVRRCGSDLEAEVQRQLVEWYGPAAAAWKLLKRYHIPHAQPSQAPADLEPAERPVRVGKAGLYVCGDHRDQASIQGALASGRRAANALLVDLFSAIG
ncbi:MAG: NAD(P)/FAD-dependent oxidoreductase [Planctomycetia bacterium]